MKRIYEIPTADTVTFTAENILTLSADIGDNDSLISYNWSDITFN